MNAEQKSTTILVLQKVELVAHRAAGKFLNSSTEYDALKMLAYELQRMQNEVEQCPVDKPQQSGGTFAGPLKTSEPQQTMHQVLKAALGRQP